MSVPTLGRPLLFYALKGTPTPRESSHHTPLSLVSTTNIHFNSPALRQLCPAFGWRTWRAREPPVSNGAMSPEFGNHN